MNNPPPIPRGKFPGVVGVIVGVAGLGLLMIAGVFAVALWPGAGVDKEAIRNAIDQRNAVHAECLRTLPRPMWESDLTWERTQKRMPKELDREKFARRLREIPVGKCPQDFREAWAGYVERCRRVADYGLARFAGDAGRTASGDFGAFGQRMDQNDTVSAWYRVEAVAQKYGVDFEPAR